MWKLAFYDVQKDTNTYSKSVYFTFGLFSTRKVQPRHRVFAGCQNLALFWTACRKHVRKAQTCCFLTPFPSLQAVKVKCGPEKRGFMRDPCEALSLCLPPQRHKYKNPYSSSLMFRSVQKYARACLHSCEKALMVTSNPILNRSPHPQPPHCRASLKKKPGLGAARGASWPSPRL